MLQVWLCTTELGSALRQDFAIFSKSSLVCSHFTLRLNLHFLQMENTKCFCEVKFSILNDTTPLYIPGVQGFVFQKPCGRTLNDLWLILLSTPATELAGTFD